MIRLYLVRHGETEDNHNGLLCGWSNISLNNKGKKQAKALAEAIKHLQVDIIYTSGLNRAVETANFIKKDRNCEMESLEFLKELDFGAFEGYTMAEIQEQHPEMFQQIKEDSIHFCFPDGESLKQMHTRVVKGVDSLLKESEGKNIMLVTHSGVIRSIIAHLLTGDINKHWCFKIDHCTLSIIERMDDFNVLTKLNEANYNL